MGGREVLSYESRYRKYFDFNYLPDSKCQNDDKVNQLFDESALVPLARVLPMTEHLIHIKAVVA